MFGQFKEFQPPSVGTSYFKGMSYGGLPPNPDSVFGYSGMHEQTHGRDDQSSVSDRMVHSPFNRELNYRANENSDMQVSNLGSARGRDAKFGLGKKSQDFVGQFRPNVAASNDYSKAIAELTGALTQAVNDKSVLETENSVLKEKVAAYEEKLSRVDKMFNTMMSRISALEHPNPALAGSIKKIAISTRQSSPRSPISAKSTPRSVSTSQQGSRSGSLLKQRGAADRSVAAASRGRVLTSSKHEQIQSARSVSAGKRQPLVTPRPAVKNVEASNVAATTRRSDRPEGATVRRTSVESVSSAVSRPSARPSSPSIRYEVHVALRDQLIAKAQLSSTLSPDGPFLYIVQCELKPHIGISAADMEGFEGLSIAVMATNTRTRQDNVIFKSHSSHIENPPINEQDGYFSHSCWLSGPEASVVGSVRMFFRREQDPLNGPMVSLYGMSLKYWFPESTENAAAPAPAFTKPHWKQLLKLLGIL